MPSNRVVDLNHDIPDWSNYAHSAGEAVHPELHRGLTNAWIPGLGPTGNTLFDLCGQKRHGTVENEGYGWVQSEIGWALDFDINDYIDLGDWAIRNPTLKGMTICVWARAEDFSPADARIISKADGTSAIDHWWMISYTSTERWRVRLKAGGTVATVVASNNNIIDLDTWHCLAFTYNQRALLDLYQEGRRIGSTGGSQTGDIENDSAGIGINLARNPDGYGRLTGQIGPTMIWNRALTFPEIELLGRDPYALVRPRKALVVKVAAAAPSPLFPPFPPKQKTLIRM